MRVLAERALNRATEFDADLRCSPAPAAGSSSAFGGALGGALGGADPPGAPGRAYECDATKGGARHLLAVLPVQAAFLVPLLIMRARPYITAFRRTPQ